MAPSRIVTRSKPERGIELYAIARRFPLISQSRFAYDIAGRRIKKVAAKLSADMVAAAEARGESRDLWQTGRELLHEFKPSEDETLAA